MPTILDTLLGFTSNLAAMPVMNGNGKPLPGVTVTPAGNGPLPNVTTGTSPSTKTGSPSLLSPGTNPSPPSSPLTNAPSGGSSESIATSLEVFFAGLFKNIVIDALFLGLFLIAFYVFVNGNQSVSNAQDAVKNVGKAAALAAI
jgi:hypothetical protein